MKLLFLFLVFLMGCNRDEAPSLPPVSGSMGAICNYVVVNHFGALGPATSVTIAADPRNESRDIVHVNICKGADCQTAPPSTICTAATPAGPCITVSENCSISQTCDGSNPARFIQINSGSVTFPGASADGYGSYAISEANCQ